MKERFCHHRAVTYSSPGVGLIDCRTGQAVLAFAECLWQTSFFSE